MLARKPPGSYTPDITWRGKSSNKGISNSKDKKEKTPGFIFGYCCQIIQSDKDTWPWLDYPAWGSLAQTLLTSFVHCVVFDET